MTRTRKLGIKLGQLGIDIADYSVWAKKRKVFERLTYLEYVTGSGQRYMGWDRAMHEAHRLSVLWHTQVRDRFNRVITEYIQYCHPSEILDPEYKR